MHEKSQLPSISCSLSELCHRLEFIEEAYSFVSAIEVLCPSDLI